MYLNGSPFKKTLGFGKDLGTGFIEKNNNDYTFKEKKAFKATFN